MRETLFRIKHKIEIRPKCATPGCNKDVAFNGTVKKPFALHCCPICTQKDNAVQSKRIQTSLDKYGCENPAQAEVVKLKYQQTCEDKYGIGIKNAWQAQEVKDKSKQTLLKNYRVDNIAKSQYSKDKHKACEKETVAKRNATHRKNKSFNTSKQEEECYALLVNVFGQEYIKRQYTSELYPFACDFYVQTYDLYIEFNGTWTHGKHAYDETNSDDIAIVDKWQAKHTKFYDNAIQTWTIRDVKKRTLAKYNNLNFREFWKIEDLKEYLKEFER